MRAGRHDKRNLIAKFFCKSNAVNSWNVLQALQTRALTNDHHTNTKHTSALNQRHVARHLTHTSYALLTFLSNTNVSAKMRLHVTLVFQQTKVKIRSRVFVIARKSKNVGSRCNTRRDRTSSPKKKKNVHAATCVDWAEEKAKLRFSACAF